MKSTHMENIHHKSKQPLEEDLDRILDAVLPKYASAEPRPGLEDRILANVRANTVLTAHYAWWHWGLAAALAATLLALAISLRSPKPHPSDAHRTAPVQPSPSTIEARKLNPDAGLIQPQNLIPIAKTSAMPIRRKARVPKNPKLDQFPSPHPLSEQEQMLALYVAQFNDQAVIVARVRTQALQLEREKEMRETGQDTNQDPQAR